MKTPKLFVALDGMEWQAATNLAWSLTGVAYGFKLNDLIAESGVAAAGPHFGRYGRFFADLKAHDIPNTVYNIVKRAVAAGAYVVTVHASGGKAMMQAAVDARKGADCLIAAVTALTSLDDQDCVTVYAGDRAQTFSRLASLAKEAGVDAIVCSAGELPLVPDGMKTIVPGIRLGQGDLGDQKAVSRAVPDCDFIVVGRPITQAKDPFASAQKIIEAIREKEGGVPSQAG